MSITGNVATDGYGLSAREQGNVPVNGYGSGIIVLLGGAVVTEAETLLTQIAAIQELVLEVEDTLAPVAAAFLTETGVEFVHTQQGTLSIVPSEAAVTAIATFAAQLDIAPDATTPVLFATTHTDPTPLDISQEETTTMTPTTDPVADVDGGADIAGSV